MASIATRSSPSPTTPATSPPATGSTFRSPTVLAVVLPALAGGVLVALSVPPAGFWPLGIAGLSLLAWRLGGLGLRRRAAAGAAFGVGLFAVTLAWVTGFHAVGYVALVLLEVSFITAAAALTPPGTARLPAFAATITLAEAARGAIPFGGFPMAGIPLGQVGGPLAPAARLGGALLVTALAAAAGAALAALIGPGGAGARRTVAAAAATLAIVVGATIAGVVAPDGGGAPAGEPRLSVAIVQGGGIRGLRAIQSDPTEVLRAHLRMSDSLAPPLDLVVWPENAIDVTSIAGTPEAEALAAVARRLSATVVAGVTEDAGRDGFENVAVAWAPSGEIVDRYVKVHRVPFGEYVPGRAFFDRLVDLQVLPRDARAGQGPGLLRTPAGRLGVAISYEVFFSERARAATRAGGEVLLVPTNAASFTTSQVPAQELAASRLRAWETGRWVIQSAPTGYGAVVDHRGGVRARTVLGEAEVVQRRVERRQGVTPYVRVGDAPVVALAVAAVSAAWLARHRPRRRSR